MRAAGGCGWGNGELVVTGDSVLDNEKALEEAGGGGFMTVDK